MSPPDGLRADEILTFLAEESRSGAETIDRPPAEIQAYREAAAVLVAVEHPEDLRPVGRKSAAESVTELLGPELIPATGRKFGGQFMLAPDIRIETIRELASTGRLEDALAANPDERDSPLQAHLERYLRQEAPALESQSLEELDATRQVAHWLGDSVEGVPNEDEVDARADFLRLLQPFEAIAGDRVFRGRTKELDELRNYIGVVSPESAMMKLRGLFRWAQPRRQPAISISGPGGAGKSALVARFMLEHTRLREDVRVPFGYLDFERGSLDIGDPLALCIELLRQLDLQFPGDGRFADIRDRAIEQWSGRSEVPPDGRLMAARDLLGQVLQQMGSVLGPRPYVVVLDTFEEVQYRGEARAFPFWDMLAKVQDSAPFLRVVVAGRAPVESLRLAGDLPRQIRLGELDDESAMAFLGTQGIADRTVQERLLRAFGRVPLSLKLVAALAARTPGGAAALLDPTAAGGSLVAASDEVIQGQLYERVLDHISDEQVRRLAHPGLVLRRINPLLILEVLNKPCGLRIDGIEQAQRLFDQLQRETSLVSLDTADGDLVHRADLRRVMLKLLVISAPAQVEQIRRRAVDWYERQPGRRGRAEEFYHRLHLGERVDESLLSDREIRSSIQAAVEEFPLRVQLRLSTLGFDVPPGVREQATREQRDASAAAQIEELLAYGPSSEKQAQAIFDSGKADIPEGSPLFRAGARIAAQRGQENQALELIECGLEGTVRAGAAEETLRLLQERAWLYRNRSRAEQTPGLALLGEHARRHQDRSALLQHRTQSIDPEATTVDRDIVALSELLTTADPGDVWGLLPALHPVIKLTRGLGVDTLSAPLHVLVQAEESPFRLTVFPDSAIQSTLEDLLYVGADSETELFRERLLRLCDAWPYRILFVVPPYGRRGEHLSESYL